MVKNGRVAQEIGCLATTCCEGREGVHNCRVLGRVLRIVNGAGVVEGVACDCSIAIGAEGVREGGASQRRLSMGKIRKAARRAENCGD